MNTATTCPNCGAPMPAASPQGICPACLLKVGLEHSSAGNPQMGVDAMTGEFDPRVAATIDHVASSPEPSRRLRQRLPEPGERLGNYQIVRMLGKGGWGP